MAHINPFMDPSEGEPAQPASGQPVAVNWWSRTSRYLRYLVGFSFGVFLLLLMWQTGSCVKKAADVHIEKLDKDYEQLLELEKERIQQRATEKKQAEEKKEEQEKLPLWVIQEAFEDLLPPAMYDDPNHHWRQAFPAASENRWVRTFPGGNVHTMNAEYGVELLKFNTAFRSGRLEFTILAGGNNIHSNKEFRILNSNDPKGFDESKHNTGEIRLEPEHDVWYIAISQPKIGYALEDGDPELSTRFQIDYYPPEKESEEIWPPGEVLTLEYHIPTDSQEEPGPGLPMWIADKSGNQTRVWWSCRIVWNPPLEGMVMDKTNTLTGEASRRLVGSTEKWTGRPKMDLTLASGTMRAFIRNEHGQETIRFRTNKATMSTESLMSENFKLTGNERLFISSPFPATVSVALFVRLDRMN